MYLYGVNIENTQTHPLRFAHGYKSGTIYYPSKAPIHTSLSSIMGSLSNLSSGSIFIRKAYADTTQGQIHYRYALPEPNHSNGITVVMLHKSASSSSSYVALMTRLVSMGCACYAPDMPGFGSSFDPSPAAIEDILIRGTAWYVDIFAEAFAAIGILERGSGIHLIGHHSGASLAPEFAAKHPSSVLSVSLIGTAVMSAPERAEMKKKYHDPFNKPVADGSHLQKTWDYLGNMGVGPANLDLYQREAVDHIRAWKGRNQIYGAVWEQDLASFLDVLACPVMFVCARDDVLWGYQEKARERWTDATYVECKGANFSPDLDPETIVEAWLAFTKKKAAISKTA